MTTTNTLSFRTWDQLSELEQLYCNYSDYYKEVNGFRPRIPEVSQTVENLKRLIKELTSAQEQERVVFDETDPELAKYQQWINDEEERKFNEQYAEQAYDNDTQFYGEEA